MDIEARIGCGEEAEVMEAIIETGGILGEVAEVEVKFVVVEFMIVVLVAAEVVLVEARVAEEVVVVVVLGDDSDELAGCIALVSMAESTPSCLSRPSNVTAVLR